MRVALVALVLALGVAGCMPSGTGSSDDFTGEEKTVAEVIDQLSSDARRRRAADICNILLSGKLREQVAGGGRDCAAEIRRAVEDADSFDLEVTDVTVTGTDATATVKAGDDAREVTKTFRLVKEDRRWRIDSFG